MLLIMCFGPFKRVCHWGPLVALSIIKAVTMSTVACLSQWWPPWMSLSGSLVFFSFMSSAVLTLYFFMQAMFTGPGVLPKAWSPKDREDCAYLQYCSVCQGYKAPRAHHCRKCGTCNMKMDHHCPWINNCVGHKNHSSFTAFLFFAVIGCAQGTGILSVSIYRAIHRTFYLYHGTGTEPLIYMSLWGLVFNMFVLGLAIGVVIAVGMLLYFQIRGICRNRTAIEDWILEKAIYRRHEDDPPYIYPYNLGRWNNFRQVVNFWCEPSGDGIIWPVAEGCHQYTLTIEQLQQKEEKRARSREYIIMEGFSGWWFPCTKGICTCLHPPCTDEPRIKLTVGDSIIVTRWKKYWLYGERLPSELDHISKVNSKSSSKSRQRGWFPRRCAVEVCQADSESDSPQPNRHCVKPVKKNYSSFIPSRLPHEPAPHCSTAYPTEHESSGSFSHSSAKDSKKIHSEGKRDAENRKNR